MKRLFAFLLACVCALALFGCAGANDDKSDGGPEDDTTPLTETQIEEFKELFASTADVTDETTGEYRYTTSTPVSCFFTSHYDDPRDIDLAEFLRYCPLSTTLGDADVEEFHAVLDTLGIENAERFKVPDDWAVPVRRMPKSDVSALLMQWADITVDDLRDQEDAIYLAQYDAFYEFTSDFGPGSFIPVGGEQYGDSIRLWSAPRGENGEGTHDELTLEVRPDGRGLAPPFWIIHPALLTAQQCRARTQSAARLPSLAPHGVRRGCWMNRLAGTRGEATYTALTLRSACSHSSYKLPMLGVEGVSPCVLLGVPKGEILF